MTISLLTQYELLGYHVGHTFPRVVVLVDRKLSVIVFRRKCRTPTAPAIV